MILVNQKELECIHLLTHLDLEIIPIVVLIKIETKIEYNKIKPTRNYFELCLTV